MIGGGPAGLSAASFSAGEGLSTLVLETKKEIGRPVQCGESISYKTLEYSGIGDGDWVVHRISRYRVISPSGDHIGSRSKGYCIDRHLFDRELSRVATSAGVETSLSTNVTSASREGECWKLRTKNGTLRSRAVILASGPLSNLCTEFGLTKNIEHMGSLCAKIDRIDTSGDLDFYVKADLKGGYGWYFPRGKEVNVGLVARDGVKEKFQRFLREIEIKPKEIISQQGGVIPDGGPNKKFTGVSVIAVGDCGGFTHPVSKGGIYCALLTGREGARSVVKLLSGDDNALIELEGILREHPGFSNKNIVRRDFLAGMDDGTLNDLTSIANGRDIQMLEMKKIIIETAKRPKLYPLVKKGLSMVKLGSDWLNYTF